MLTFAHSPPQRTAQFRRPGWLAGYQSRSRPESIYDELCLTAGCRLPEHAVGIVDHEQRSTGRAADCVGAEPLHGR